MDPLRFHPILKRSRWGGRRLAVVLAKPLGPQRDYAESWEIADRGDDQSVVRGGEYDGWTLARLVRERNVELFGRHAGRLQFPLLVKYLDACDRLSVQVHPNDEQARRFDPHERGKTEAWVVLEAEPGSRVYAGLKDGVDREQLQQHVKAGSLEQCLHEFEVFPGDCVFVPAGTVHAIGEGILLAEVQQSSDITFRLDDWGRLGADGKPRPLHVAEALDCIDFTRGQIDPARPRMIDERSERRIEELVHCEHFVLRRITIHQPMTIETGGRFHVLTCLHGGATWRSGHSSGALRRGETLLVPAAAAGIALAPGDETALLDAFLP
ncbi:MAG: class I mannose-6-phosphate isomerase [Planctomycetes bacterium]|nr:class I mannose-6-phosphate isomerase [Planctomycetota bacterium]